MTYHAADSTENVFIIPKRKPVVDGVDGASHVVTCVIHVLIKYSRVTLQWFLAGWTKIEHKEIAII